MSNAGFDYTAEGALTVTVLGVDVLFDVSIDYSVTDPGRPAFISGPPEYCYAAEPAEFRVADTFDFTLPGSTEVHAAATDVSEAVAERLHDIVATDWANNHADDGDDL